jgi:hypothetical protein
MNEQELTDDEIAERLRELHARNTRVGHKPGWRINNLNQLERIPGSISGYENGEPVITSMSERKPRWTKLSPVSISDLLREAEQARAKAPVNEGGPSE